jgi:hypothetical protein
MEHTAISGKENAKFSIVKKTLLFDVSAPPVMMVFSLSI